MVSRIAGTAEADAVLLGEAGCAKVEQASALPASTQARRHGMNHGGDFTSDHPDRKMERPHRLPSAGYQGATVRTKRAEASPARDGGVR
jgi:hypothetical protein